MDRRIERTLDSQSPQFPADDRLQPPPQSERYEIAGAVIHCFLDFFLGRLLAERDYRDFRIEPVFVLDDLVNRFGVTVAI